MHKGCLVTLEGGEGSGKTTLLNRLAQFFKNKGFHVIATREPGGSLLGEMIRNWLLENRGNVPIGSLAELLLFLAARAQHIEEKIKPAIDAGCIVLCDRFNDSTIAYQGGARGLGVDYVKSLCTLVCGSLAPKLTLFLDVPPEIGLARSRGVSKENAAKGELDRIESEAFSFHCKIRETMLFLAAKEPSRIFTLDATQSLELVEIDAVAVIQQCLFPSR